MSYLINDYIKPFHIQVGVSRGGYTISLSLELAHQILPKKLFML